MRLMPEMTSPSVALEMSPVAFFCAAVVYATRRLLRCAALLVDGVEPIGEEPMGRSRTEGGAECLCHESPQTEYV